MYIIEGLGNIPKYILVHFYNPSKASEAKNELCIFNTAAVVNLLFVNPYYTIL